MNPHIYAGGPAFPVNTQPGDGGVIAGYPEFGMTLRDYFAAKALETVVAYPQEDTQHWTPENFAAHAYEVADAMLRARDAKR